MKKLLLALLTLVALQTQAQCWKHIASQGSYVIGIKSDGTLWAWGHNYSGSLGNGSTGNISTPMQIGVDSNWTTVATGWYTNIALKSDGTLWGWGANSIGQIPGGSNPQTTPIQIGTDTDWKSITTSGYHMLAIKNNGTLWVWGDNHYGSLGLGNTENATIPVQLGTDTDWSVVSAGLVSYTSYALKTNGTLWAWGKNNYGQVGNGIMNTIPVTTPVQVGVDSDWKGISAGNEFVLAIKADNTLWGWGSNVLYQLGSTGISGSASPIQITNNTWISFNASDVVSTAVKSDGTLYKWGSEPYYVYSAPYKLNEDVNWSRTLSSGPGINMVIKNNNEIYVWGLNTTGELGLGNTNQYSQPTLFGTMCGATAGLNDNTLTSIILYPNPTSSTLTLANAENLSIEKLTVTDLTGKVVMTQKSNNTQLDVQQLPAGMYFLNVSANGNIQHLKFIKQ